jgi:hypothetical protein
VWLGDPKDLTAFCDALETAMAKSGKKFRLFAPEVPVPTGAFKDMREPAEIVVKMMDRIGIAKPLLVGFDHGSGVAFCRKIRLQVEKFH